MFSKCLAKALCICCLITILKLEELEALPLRSVNPEDNAKNSSLSEEEADEIEALPVLAKSKDRQVHLMGGLALEDLPLRSVNTEDNAKNSTLSEKEAEEIEALPVLAKSEDRQVQLMGGLAPGVRLFPINAGYPEEASRRRAKKPKKLKTPRPAGQKVPKFQGENKKRTDPPKELTISVPSFKTDSFGQWVYNPWGATFGKVWQDTRFHVNHQSRMPRLRLDSDPGRQYYPDDEFISTVCWGRSTLYNKPEVYEFMRSKEYNRPHAHRPIFMELRREHYRMARSEECHNSNLTDFLAYQNCAIQRNQRMEYLLPMYPRQQLR